MDLFIDFLLDILVKLFDWLKKKSQNTYYQNMELVNSKTLKQELITEIFQVLEKLKIDIPQELKLLKENITPTTDKEKK